MSLGDSALNLLFNQTNGLPGALYTGFLKHTVAEARPVTVRNSGGVQKTNIDVRLRADGIGHDERTHAAPVGVGTDPQSNEPEYRRNGSPFENGDRGGFMSPRTNPTTANPPPVPLFQRGKPASGVSVISKGVSKG